MIVVLSDGQLHRCCPSSIVLFVKVKTPVKMQTFKSVNKQKIHLGAKKKKKISKSAFKNRVQSCVLSNSLPIKLLITGT